MLVASDGRGRVRRYLRACYCPYGEPDGNELVESSKAARDPEVHAIRQRWIEPYRFPQTHDAGNQITSARILQVWLVIEAA